MQCSAQKNEQESYGYNLKFIVYVIQDFLLQDVALNAHESYQSCTEKACSVLGMSTANKKVLLLRTSGSIIPDKPIGTDQVWTIGQYLEQACSCTCSPKNFIVATVEVVS